MGFGFDRPIGAGADVAELEYISALHQTDVHELRKDGSVSRQDIALFLMSRHGLRVAPEQVEERILGDLQGSNGSMDLVTLVSLLLIPRVKSEAQSYVNNNSNDDSNSSNSMHRVLTYTLDVLLHDTFRDDSSSSSSSLMRDVMLNKDTLKRILLSMEEDILANDDELLEQMLQAAGATDNTPLTVHTLAKAVSSDLDLYNLANSTSLSTNMQDVMEDKNGKNNRKENEDEDEDEAVVNKKKYPMQFVKTFAFIDFAADTYRSRPLVVVMWSYFVLSFFTYFFGRDLYDLLFDCDSFGFRSSWAEEATTLACQIGWSVGNWLQTLLFMGLYGMFYFGLVGIGNSIESTEPSKPLLGALFGALCTYVPYILDAGRGSVEDAFLRFVCIVIGTGIVLFNIWHFVTLIVPKKSQLYEKWQYYLTPEAIRAETLVKQAGLHKVNRMISNAFEMHRMKVEGSVIDSHIGQALWNYFKSIDANTERAGGFRWTWWRIWSLELFKEEGLWFSARLIAINLAQVILAVFVLVLGLAITISTVTNYDPPNRSIQVIFQSVFDLKPKDSLGFSIVYDVASEVGRFLSQDTGTECPMTDISPLLECNSTVALEACRPENVTWLCAVLEYSTNNTDIDVEFQTSLLERAGFAVNSVFNDSMVVLDQATQGTVDSLYPTDKYMILAPMLVATFAAFITSASIASSLTPSITSTVLKLRSGVIPLMHNPKHTAIRIAPDQVAILQGSLFWGTLFSAALMGSFWGGLVFLYTWQATTRIAQTITAAVIAITTVVLLHFFFVRNCRFVTSKAFYRKRVLTANLVLLARECGFFALTVGFVLVRVTKLLFTTILFVGRVDRPFLADGVGEIEAFGYKIDNYPYVFLMEILQHEAHRHPYLESLGVVYLMKMKHGHQFCNRAGTAWRILVVLAMMPWLSKYRQTTKKVENEFPMVVDLEGQFSKAFTVKPLRTSDEFEVDNLRRQVEVLKAQLSDQARRNSMGLPSSKLASGES